MQLLRKIDEWASTAPERVAHRSGGADLTWRDLARRSDLLAGAISRAGIAPASPVVLHGHKEPEMLVGMLGCAKSGHPYVPIDASVPAIRVARIIVAAAADLVLTPERIRTLEAGHHPPPPPSGDATTPHYVMFTSGSTGEPKGVVITRGCLDAFLGWMLAEQAFAPSGEVFLNQAVFSFDLSVMDTWCCLAAGGTLVSLTSDETRDYRRLFATLGASGITTWVSTPTFAQLCLAERSFNDRMLPHLRRFLFCGDVLTPDVANQLLDRFPLAGVWNTYGPTEATVATTSVRIDRDVVHAHPQLPIGRAMPGTSVTIEDSSGAEVPAGTRGEIVIVGPNVSPGYLGRPDLTARSFFTRGGQRGYRTGDWGVSRDGLLFFLGRMDSQVKIAGHRIEIGDVETHLASLPAIQSAVVLPAYAGGRPESLHAFVMLAQQLPGSPFEVDLAIRRALGALIPAYMMPRKIHVLDQFPLTVNGKTDRRALAALISA